MHLLDEERSSTDVDDLKLLVDDLGVEELNKLDEQRELDNWIVIARQKENCASAYEICS